MKYIAIAILFIASTTTVAEESPMQRNGIAAIKALASGIVDSQIEAYCLKQIDGENLFVKNKKECSEALTKIETSLGDTDAADLEKAKIAQFRKQYMVYGGWK